MVRIVPAVVVLVASLAGPPVAAARTPATGPKDAGAIACVASVDAFLAWVDGARALASRLGLPAKSVEWLSERSKALLGADLLESGGWRALGVDPAGPACVFAGSRTRTGLVASFPVDSERRVVAALARALAPDPTADKPVPAKAVPFKVGRAKAWRFESAGPARKGKGKAGASEGGPVLAIVDDVGYVAFDKADLEFLAGAGPGSDEDFTTELAFPKKPVAGVVLLRFDALGRALGAPSLESLATGWMTRARLEATVDGSLFALRATGLNAGILTLVGGAIAASAPAPDARLAMAGRVDDSASGFVQLNLPFGAVAEALQSAGTKKAGAGARGAGAFAELLESLGGDVTLSIDGGLAGLGAIASLNDPARAERALAGVVAAANEAGIGVSEEALEIGATPARLLRFGAPDATFRIPVIVAVRDTALVAAFSRARVEDLLGSPKVRYLDRMDSPATLAAVRAGAVVASHGYGTDLVGNLPALLAVARDGLSGEGRRWADLVELPVLALDLLNDASLTVTVDAHDTTLGVEARFLAGDPMAREPRAKAYGMALRARYAGRPAAWRGGLLDLMQAGPDDAYGRKARRVLLAPEPLTDVVLAGALAMMMMGASQPAAEAVAIEPTPCQQYLLRACVGRDPDSAPCKDARHYFESGTGTPTPEAEQECAQRNAAGR